MKTGCTRVGLALVASLLATVACVSTASFVREDGSVDVETLYRRKCSQCHALYDPTDFTDDEWETNVGDFAPRAGLKPEWRPLLIEWLQEANDDPSSEEV